MTISTQQSSEVFLGNGITTAFNFTFVGDSSNYIVVTYTDTDGTATVLSSSQYSISLTPTSPGALWSIGGTVNYPLVGSPIASGTSLTVARILPLTQEDSISNQGAFAPTVIETALDTLLMQIQQTSTRSGLFRGTWTTAILYNFGDYIVDGVNGNDTGNYYTCILTNTSGTWSTDLAAGDWALVINVQSITDDVAAAAASASAAATSATSASSSASTATTQASNASTSATTATTQASNASTSATNAANSATSASTSATSSSSSASTATTQASNASTSATNAATSATASANSATASASSASAAAASAASLSGGLSATSITSLAIATGAKTFTIQASKLFVAGQILIAASDASALNYMHGTVTSYSGTTLVMNITDIGGSGTHTDWTISVSGTQGTGTVTNVSGISNRISVATGTTTPIIDIAAAYVGQTSITTLGIIGTGVWNGTALTPTYGGTGLATLTANNVILGNGTSNVQFVAPGTSGNILTSNGSTWTSSANTIGSGNKVKLSTQNASASASIIFNSTYINSTYDDYEIQINNLVSATDNTILYLLTSRSSSFDTTQYGWAVASQNTTTTTNTGDENGTEIQLTSAHVSNVATAASGFGHITVNLYNMNGASVSPYRGTFQGMIQSSVGSFYGIKGSLGTNYAGSFDGIKFLMSSGNITSGSFTLYGIIK